MLTVMDEETVHVRAVVDVDFNMYMVPMSLINFAARHLLYYAFKLFAAKAQSLDELPHAGRIHAPFYTYLRTRVQHVQ